MRARRLANVAGVSGCCAPLRRLAPPQRRRPAVRARSRYAAAPGPSSWRPLAPTSRPEPNLPPDEVIEKGESVFTDATPERLAIGTIPSFPSLPAALALQQVVIAPGGR